MTTLLHRCRPWCGVVAVVAAVTAFAQTEQWLQYHVDNSGQGYRWLDLTTNAPAGVALPKLSAQPWFARWTTSLDPQGGRWLCFDRTRKSGPHNRLFLDRNGNGQLDDESPLEATQVDSYSASFEPARMVFKGEDGPITYHLLLRFMRYGADDMRVLASSGCYYDGKVTVDGNKRLVRLVDGNANGTFNDLALDPDDGDRVFIDGDGAGDRLLGRMVEVSDKLYAIEVAPDGAFVKLQPAQNVALGRMRVPEAISEFAAVGQPGEFSRKPTQGEFTLPVGRYRVLRWAIDRRDDKGAEWQLAGSGTSDFGSFEVIANQPMTLDVGEPVQAALTVTENKGGANFGLRLKGRLGESVDVMKGRQRPRAPQLQLASAGGAFRATHTFEYG